MNIVKLKKLVRELSSAAEENRSLIIGVDGVDGSGKSTLALRIAKEISAKVIEIDNYVKEKRGEYLANLDFDGLRNEVNQHLSTNTSPIILEGVCLLSVLEQIGISPNKVVYVKRTGLYGFWMDEDLCNPSIPLEDILRSIDKSENVPGTGNLDREIARYHRKYVPQERTDFVFERAEPSRQIA